MSNPETSRLDLWKSHLLDRAAADPLLDAATEHVGIAFAGVDAVAMAVALATGASFRIEPGATSDLETGRLRGPIAASDLERRLRGVTRSARTRRLATGEAVVSLALGELSWIDITGVAHPAPLALWPVELVARDGDFEVVPVAREPRANAVLAAKLARDFGFELPAEFELTAWSDAAAAFALTRPGWSVRRTVSLGVFPLARATIAADVAGVELAAHPLLERLATRATSPRMTLPVANVADVIAPLDADTSQLAAIAAAGEGASFVLVGPPGTGKSQTIANLVAHCATQGKSVLVVSDKPAAREVVQARLAAVGLGELCLALDQPPGKVVTQLGRVLDRAFRPGSGPNGVDPRLGELRAALDRHAQALHHVGPFGRPLHEVIGRLVELRTSPNAALAERDATGLDRGSFERRKQAVEALARAAVPVEPVGTHPWRASTLERWPMAEDDHADRRRRTVATLAETRLASEELGDAAREVVALIPGLVAHSAAQLIALGTLAAVAATSPRPGAELLTQLRSTRGDELGERVALIRARGTGTVETPRDPAAFLAVAARHRALALEVDDRFTDAIEQLDVGALWSQLKKWTASVAPLRFVALRTVRAEVRSAALPGELNSDQAMIDALEAAIAERACRAALTAAAEPARRWFGELGGDPLVLDLPKIDAAVGWAAELRKAFDAADVTDVQRTTAWRALVAQVASNAGGDDLGVFARAADAVFRWQQAIAALAETTGIPVAALGPTPAAYPDHLANLTEQATYLEQAVDALRDWVGFHAARRDARTAGVGPAIGAIESGDLGAEELAAAWERATLLAWGDAELADQVDLASFHGAAHHASVAAYADLDRAAVALARTRAIARLADRVPARRGSTDPEVAVLLDALARQTRALVDPATPVAALRDLFVAMPALLSRLAPCVVASPLAVARDLDRALPRFDVVVFDEASQLPVGHALGAIARAGAIVVVGDPRQLAPDDGSESLLACCLAAQLPELALATHYRSRHEDLFATANRLAYGDRLAGFPVAQGSSELGISWKRVDAIYDRVTGRNRDEAEAVVAEVCARLRDPVQRTRSIAVATFAAAQRDLIADLLDAARTADCAIDGAFEAAAESVLVETVDTLQGHERDVVIVAVGYGSDADGHLGTSFGVLAEPGGERAALVAFTRAREQLVIVSSFAPEDLPVDAPLGVRHLGETIAFARAGGGAGRGGDEAASPITAAIARALGERGWTVRHQVGCGAYKIDLAVVDPNDPERYVLAIEHDGRAYAGAPGARDRDRLRAQVLTSLGWRLHRIWTLDWWGDTERELARAHGAIVSSIAASRTRRAPTATPTRARSASGRHSAAAIPVVVKIPPKAGDLSQPSSVPELALDAGITLATGTGSVIAAEASAPIRLKRGSIAIGPYSAALIPAGRRAPDDMFAPRHVAELGKIVEQVLAAEAPMHLTLLARRVGAYFGIGRLSQRVTDQVKHALEGRARWGAEDDIVWRLDQDPTMVPAVRVAGSGAEARRGIGEVPLAELASAARIVVERAGGIAATDLVRDTARLLGFARITPDVVARIDIGVRLAMQRELIRLDDGRASIPS